MRTLSAGLMLLLAMAVGPTGSAIGQEGLVVKFQDLQLTDAQEAKIGDIRKECRPKVQEAAKELGTIVREEFEKIAAILTPEQKQKVQALREEREDRREECLAHAIASLKELDLTDAEMTKIGDIRKGFRPRMEKVTRELEGFLSDAQKKARAEALSAGKNRREVLQALKLTDEQRKSC